MNKPQTTTAIGGMGITGSMTNLIHMFNGYKIEELPSAFMSLDAGQFILSVAGILASIYAIRHNEDR